jgi:hypothetical protein
MGVATEVVFGAVTMETCQMTGLKWQPGRHDTCLDLWMVIETSMAKQRCGLDEVDVMEETPCCDRR